MGALRENINYIHYFTMNDIDITTDFLIIMEIYWIFRNNSIEVERDTNCRLF